MGLQESKGGWAVTHVPAVNIKATVTQAAAGGGFRTVCRSLSAKIRGGTTAPAAIAVKVQLRDGATGAGIILHEWQLVLAGAVAAKDDIELTDLWIQGSPNTAMTLEFDVAGGLNTFESVNMAGIVIPT